jgi:hypothetical protein
LIEDTNELDNFIAEHPKVIHAYFQQRKQDLLKQQLDIIAKEQQLQKQQIIWCTEEGISYIYNPDKENSSDQEAIRPVDNKPNFYVMIDQKLVTKLQSSNHQLLKNFEKALSKGFVSKEYGNRGIKIMSNKLAELKTSGDDRLYTDCIYKNSQGKYLINFNKHGNHDKVIKILNSLDSLKIIEIDETSYSPTLPKESEYSTSECTTPELDLPLAMKFSRR